MSDHLDDPGPPLREQFNQMVDVLREVRLRISAIVISSIGASRSLRSGHRDRSVATPGGQASVELGLLSSRRSF